MILGGTYSGQLVSEVTKVLITGSASGDKYKYAKMWKIPCCVPDWIHDSVEFGYSLDYNDYTMRAKLSSTPTDSHEASKSSPCLLELFTNRY